MIPKTNKEFSRLAGSGLPRNAGKLHNDPAKYQSGMQRPTAARGQEAQAQQSAEQAAAKDAALRSAGLVGAGAGLLSKAVSAVSPKRSDRFTNEDWANLQRTVWKKTHEKQLEQVKNRLEARGALIDVPTRATAAASRQLQEQLMEHEQRATPAAVNAIGGSDAYQLLKRLRADFFLDWSKKTTDQQREALEHSGLTRQEWWKLLNLDEHYLETLSDIRNIREHRGAYGLSPKEADEVYGRLIDLASSRAFASGREAPFASSGARNTFLEMLRNDEAALFESIGYVRGSAPLARGGTQTAYGRIDGPGAAHIRQGDGIGKTHPAWYDKNDAAAEPPAPQTFGNVLKTLFLSLLFPYGCAPAPDTPEQPTELHVMPELDIVAPPLPAIQGWEYPYYRGVVQQAEKYLGTEYREMPCSALTAAVYGISFPEIKGTAENQWKVVTGQTNGAGGKHWDYTEIADPDDLASSGIMYGDMLFFACPECACGKERGDTDRCSRSNIHHVAIYIGNGWVLDSGRNGVSKRPISDILPDAHGSYIPCGYARPKNLENLGADFQNVE